MKYNCEICGYETDNPQAFGGHRSSHTRNESYLEQWQNSKTFAGQRVINWFKGK